MRSLFSRRQAVFGFLALLLPSRAPAVRAVASGAKEVVFLSPEIQPLALAASDRRWFVVGKKPASRAELQASKERLKRWITT